MSGRSLLIPIPLQTGQEAAETAAGPAFERPADHRDRTAGEPSVLDEGEPVVGPEQVAGLPVQVAATGDSVPRRREQIVQTPGDTVGPDVFEKPELTARPEDACEFPECGSRIGDRTEHERSDDSVEGVVVVRQRFGACVRNIDGEIEVGSFRSSLPTHRRIGFDRTQFDVGPAGKVREHRARSGAEIEDSPRKLCREILAVGRQHRPLGDGHDRIVQTGNNRVRTAHTSTLGWETKSSDGTDSPAGRIRAGEIQDFLYDRETERCEMNVRRYALLFGLLSVCAAAGAVGVTATEGEPPLADAGLDQSVQRNSTVYLDAGGSVAPNGDIVESDWEIEGPDGSPVSPACPNCERTRFRPTELGVYNATVTVTDDAGLSTSDTLRVTVVRQEPPEVSVTGPGRTVVGESPRVTLTATAGDEPLGSRIWFVDGEQYDTGFLDGSSATESIAPPATEAGVLVIEARVTDEQGLWATDRHTVEVREESDSSDGDGEDGGDDSTEDGDDDSTEDGDDDSTEDGDDGSEDEAGDDSGNEPDDETDETEDAPDPPYFAVEITGNSTASGDLTVTADITNTGNVTDGQNIRLCENSCPGSEDSRFERIAGGQTETVTLTWTGYTSETTGQTTTVAVASDDDETLADAPHTTTARRIDQTSAARDLRLSWQALDEE